MRGSLGATRKEIVLADDPHRQVVLVHRDEGPRIVRRIRAQADGPDLVARASALGLVRQVPIRGLALIEDRAIVGGRLEIAESYVHGIDLASALETFGTELTVGVAISLIHELASGLAVLHGITDSGGHLAPLIHGRIGVDQIRITRTGDPCLVGLDGLRGDPGVDLRALLQVLHSILSGKSASSAGVVLLERLASLEFESARQMVGALSAYLDRQNQQDLAAKKSAFAAQVALFLEARGDPLGVGLPREPAEGATEISLGAAPSMHIDDASDRPTVAIVAQDVREPSDENTSELESRPTNAVRKGIMAPLAAPPPSPTPPVPRGSERSVTVGNYRVVASIGRGGMGEIYLARSTSPHYRGLVALKVLGAEDSDDDEALGMFMDEAAIMARIDHPNVLRVVDFGRAKGRHFLAMEYLEGRPLVRVMIDAFQKESGLDYATVAALGADAARGLHAAHVARTPEGMPLHIVHRDVSPQNIFVTYAGVTKVIDFGVARAAERVSKTEVGIVKGKAAYMSPEQTEGKAVDARSDVFSLGVCLWEMIAGRRLFKRDTEYDTLVAVATLPIERPTQVRGKPNAALDRIVMNALTRNREKRTQTAEQLFEQLTGFAEKSGLVDRAAAIRELMERLFGAAAAEERALIRQLEKRTATEEEQSSLLRLSGVAHRKKSKEMTLVGAPSGLIDLDRFGERGPEEERPRVPTVAGQIVLRAVEALKAEQAGTLPPRELVVSDDALDTLGVPQRAAQAEAALEPERAYDAEEGETIQGEGSARGLLGPAGTFPVEVRHGSSLRAQAGEGTRATSEPGGAIEVSEEDIDSIRARTDASLRLDIDLVEPEVGVPPDPVLSPQGTSPTTAYPSFSDKLLRYAIWAAASAVVLLVAIAVATLRRPPVIDADLSEPALAPPTTAAPATVAGQEGPKVFPVVTETSSVGAMLAELEGKGFTISASEATWLITAADGASWVLDAGAEVELVESQNLRGFLARTTRRGLPRALWAGSAEGGRMVVRPLTVNDCPAIVRVLDGGVRVTYVGKEVILPHGGRGLSDVTLERPDFADRVVLEPLGLAFGRRDPAAGAGGHCSIGWWGPRVVLRSVPEGRYTLRWSGGGQELVAPLEVTQGESKGAGRIKTSSVAR